MTKINLAEKFVQISEYFSPRIAGELNGQHVKLVKFASGFVWHKHDHEDEMFLVVDGEFVMEYREADGSEHAIVLREGEFLVVPRGMEHRPVAQREVCVLLFEPAGTLNTGDAAGSEYTVREPGRI